MFQLSQEYAFPSVLTEYAEKLIRERAIAIEGLTEKQTAQALLQAIACGDFTRLVRVDNEAQAVTYIPFRNEEILRSRIKQLEELLKANQIEIPNEFGEEL